MFLIAAAPEFFSGVINYVYLGLVAGLAIGVVIFVHELGHFAVAKACGVQCDKFYVGFDIGGKSIVKFKYGETVYGVGILPLGGYVKMLGQDDDPGKAAEEMQRAKNGSGGFNPRSYLAKPVWQRMLIISAGVIMNVIFAFFAASLAFLLGVELNPATVGAVTPGGPAWKAGLRMGDEIVQIGDKTDPIFEDLIESVALGENANGLPLVVNRGGKTQTLTVFPEPGEYAPEIKVGPITSLVLSETEPVIENYPASQSKPGFEGGDKIIAIGQGGTLVPVQTYADLYREFSHNVDKTLQIKVQRKKSGEELLIDVGPNPLKDLGLIMQMGPIVAVRKDSPAALAGIQPGDVILSVNGVTDVDPVFLPEYLRGEGGKEVTLAVRRGEEQLDLTVRLEDSPPVERPYGIDAPLSVASLGVAYRVITHVTAVEDGPSKGQILPGDIIVSAEIVPSNPENRAAEADRAGRSAFEIEFNEEEQNWPWFYLYRLQQSQPDSKVTFTLLRDGNQHQVTITPQQSSQWFIPERGFILTPLMVKRKAESLPAALSFGADKTWNGLTMVVRVLKRVGSGQVSPKSFGGPGTMLHAAGSEASKGFSRLLLFLVLLSTNLAVINFLPIPVLDGGHMMFLLYEAIARRPANERWTIRLHYLGLSLVLSLMLFVIGLDVFRYGGWLFSLFGG